MTRVWNPHRTLQKDGTVAEGFKPDEIVDALHGPTGNKEPLTIGFNHRQNPVSSLSLSLSLDTDEAAALVDVEVRRLTPVERERLMGLPDGWTQGVPDSARNAQTGNAVVVPVVEWIARRLVAVDAEMAL